MYHDLSIMTALVLLSMNQHVRFNPLTGNRALALSVLHLCGKRALRRQVL